MKFGTAASRIRGHLMKYTSKEIVVNFEANLPHSCTTILALQASVQVDTGKDTPTPNIMRLATERS